MVKNHLKRIAAPKTWHIKRKNNKYIMKANPGAHSMNISMPLSLVLRQLIKVAKTTKEAKQILNIKDVFVDKRKRTEEKLPVGFMDIIEFPQLEKQYRILLDEKGRLTAQEADINEANIKLARVESKAKVRGGKTQLKLFGGRNIIVDKDDYKVGDSLKITLPDQQIQEKIELKSGAIVLLLGGKRAGTIVKVDQIGETKIILQQGKEKFETLKKYAFVVGKDKPSITSIKKHMDKK